MFKSREGDRDPGREEENRNDGKQGSEKLKTHTTDVLRVCRYSIHSNAPGIIRLKTYDMTVISRMFSSVQVGWVNSPFDLNAVVGLEEALNFTSWFGYEENPKCFLKSSSESRAPSCVNATDLALLFGLPI
jgi:hypothetical protein